MHDGIAAYVEDMQDSREKQLCVDMLICAASGGVSLRANGTLFRTDARTN